MREFLSRLGSHDRVLLIGDTRQHQGVEAGRPFEQLQQAGMRTAHLDEIVRQKDSALKSAVEFLAKGDVSSALDSLQRQGRIREVPDAGERVREIAKSYVDSPDKTLIVSPDNVSRRELNMAVREELKAKGTLSPDEHTFKVLIQRQEMTGAERAWASQYEVGDVIRYSRGSKTMGIEPGSYATVVRVNPVDNHLSPAATAFRNDRNLRCTPSRRDQRLSRNRSGVCRRGSDSIHCARRIVECCEPRSSGHRFGPSRSTDFSAPRQRSPKSRKFSDPALHQHFDHGYAVTSHSGART